MSENSILSDPEAQDHEGPGAEKGPKMGRNPEAPEKSDIKDLTDKDIFTNREKRDFLRAVDDVEDLIFIRLGFYGGLRISEIRNLNIEDLIINSESVPVLHIRNSKGNKSRYVLIDEATAQIIFTYRERVHAGPILPGNDSEGRISTRQLTRRFNKVLERSGITRINPSPHSMRHTHITMLLSRGMSLEKVQAQAGHSDIRYTAIYEHLTYLDRSREYSEIMGE